MPSDRELAAASALEDIAVLAKQISSDIRDGHSGGAYPRLYWLRWKLGKIVAGLGEMGVPPAPDGPDAMGEHYEKYIQK